MTINEMLEHIEWQLKEYQREYEKLTAESTEWESKYYELYERIDKAIDYIKHSQSYGTMAQVMPHLKPYINGDDLLDILQGEDNGKDN